MTAIETPAAPLLLRTLEKIELARVTDNPWQPRSGLAEDMVKEIADSIREVGLLQPPLVRPVLPGKDYQIAFGHYRIAALRLLSIETAELEVRNLSDAEMAIIALTENRKRRDVPPIEQYRAWQKALEIEGMSIAMFADALGLDRSTVSNNLRLLKLPEWILAHVDAGELAAHAAREFLCLMGSDGHFHDDVARQAIDKMTKGVPDWRASRVRMEIANVILVRPVKEWRKLFSGGHNGDPAFDVAKFKEDFEPRVHTLPNDDWTDGVWRDGERQPGKVKKESSRDWTCATSAWVSKQNAGKKAAEGVAGAASKDKAAEGPVKSGSFVKVLAADPVFLSVSPETAGPLLKSMQKDELDADAAAALGTRAVPQQLIKAGFKAYVDGRANNGWDQGLTDIPSYFPDIAECRKTCIIGATYGRFGKSGAFALYCLNKEHFAEKAAKGRESIMRKVTRKWQAQNDADAKLYGLLNEYEGWSLPPAMAALLVAWVLRHGGRFEPIYPDNVNNHDERRQLGLWPANTVSIYTLIGHNVEKDDWLQVGKALKALSNLGADETKELLLRLVVEESGGSALAPFVKALGGSVVLPGRTEQPEAEEEEAEA